MFRVTVIFDERNGDVTELTMESRYPSAENLDDALEFGADDGAAQTLGRFAEYLRRDESAGGDDR